MSKTGMQARAVVPTPTDDANRVSRDCFEHLVFDIWICFGFRASDFEF
jgi:hypothetical protein